MNPVKVKHLENEIVKLEAELNEITQQVCAPGFYQTVEESERDRLLVKQKKLQDKLQALEEQWVQQL